MGRTLYTNTINTDTKNVTISGLSSYRFFVAIVSSTYSEGIAIGFRWTSTDIRFFGISDSVNAPSISSVQLSCNNDMIVSVDGKFGQSANGIRRITGIF